MKKHPATARRYRGGFTLVELLVVIAIIAILAAMIMPALVGVQKRAKIVKAKAEIADIANAINAYDSEYSRFPITSGGLSDEQGEAKGFDFTTGLVFGPGNNASKYSYDNNSNVVSILMDVEKFPNGYPTSNDKHVKNPKQIKFLNAKRSESKHNDADPLPGVDEDGIYRDPWGNPYIISMDTSYDDQVSDFIYSQASVSQDSGQTGFYGLSNPNAPGNTDNFLFHGKVMVWSAGPDKKYDSTIKAKAGVNKDNILSWAQ